MTDSLGKILERFRATEIGAGTHRQLLLELNHVINVSVNQTLTRTIITSGTALLTALALFFFGGEVLHGFAFTMIVGIITGTYSSVFIAAAIVSLWRGSAPTRAAAHAPAATPATAPQQPTRRQKPQRKARAS